jgi:hypothetical protein
MNTVVPYKFIASAVDGYGNHMGRVFIYRREQPPSENFARLCLRLFVRKKFSVRIYPATDRDLS